MRSHYLDQLVALHLFAKDGADQKLDETEEFKSMIANAKRDILAQLSMAEALKTATVSEEEIRTFYEENKNQFAKGGTVRAKHILTDSEDKCKEILEEIERNKSLRDGSTGVFHLSFRPERRRSWRIRQRPDGKRV